LYKIFPDDTMSPKERIRAVIDLKIPDRVPIAPTFGSHIVKAGGITGYDIQNDGVKAAIASYRTWKRYGGFDMFAGNFLANYLLLFPDSHSRFFFDWTMPTKDSPRFSLPQMNEKTILTDYDILKKKGLMHFLRIEDKNMIPDMIKVTGEAIRFFTIFQGFFPKNFFEKNFQPYAQSIINHPADILAFMRGIRNFLIDLRRQPDKVKEMCEWLADGLTEAGKLLLKLINGNIVLYGCSRVSNTWISPKMFGELFWDTMKRQIWQLHKAGYFICFHLDNDWTKNIIEFFRELPKKCGFLHLDQANLIKLKDEIGDHLCLMGNLDPATTRLASPKDVEKKCKKLIEICGEGGGYILGNACELPIDAKIENIIAMKKAVEKYGWYKA